MQQAEAIALIDKGITGSLPQRWADLGCGNGTFTVALAKLLPPESYINAIDMAQQRLPTVSNEIRIEFTCADFVNEQLPLDTLNGILMANSLHYVAHKAKLINKLEGYFDASPKFLIVEYDTMKSNPWVPYPISFHNLNEEFNKLGYQINKLAQAPSRFGGIMYSALAFK
jgi:ubiquinone/menaquinone biosynthesis C-methylase UbiE